MQPCVFLYVSSARLYIFMSITQGPHLMMICGWSHDGGAHISPPPPPPLSPGLCSGASRQGQGSLNLPVYSEDSQPTAS